jgi:hypothetical protein
MRSDQENFGLYLVVGVGPICQEAGDLEVHGSPPQTRSRRWRREGLELIFGKKKDSSNNQGSTSLMVSGRKSCRSGGRRRKWRKWNHFGDGFCWRKMWKLRRNSTPLDFVFNTCHLSGLKWEGMGETLMGGEPHPSCYWDDGIAGAEPEILVWGTKL